MNHTSEATLFDSRAGTPSLGTSTALSRDSVAMRRYVHRARVRTLLTDRSTSTATVVSFQFEWSC